MWFMSNIEPLEEKQIGLVVSKVCYLILWFWISKEVIRSLCLLCQLIERQGQSILIRADWHLKKVQ